MLFVHQILLYIHWRFGPSSTNKPNEVYTAEFTGKGHCLNNTPYDPSKGALTNVNKVDGQDVLSVMPRAANSYTPSVLFFTADGSRLNFADHQTGSSLVNASCIDVNSGQ